MEPWRRRRRGRRCARAQAPPAPRRHCRRQGVRGVGAIEAPERVRGHAGTLRDDVAGHVGEAMRGGPSDRSTSQGTTPAPWSRSHTKRAAPRLLSSVARTPTRTPPRPGRRIVGTPASPRPPTSRSETAPPTSRPHSRPGAAPPPRTFPILRRLDCAAVAGNDAVGEARRQLIEDRGRARDGASAPARLRADRAAQRSPK